MENIQINNQTVICQINLDNVKKIINIVLGKFEQEKKIISLLFCDNKLIQDLNNKYRKKDYATDVLSFEELDDKDFLGDIAISVEKANEQCNDYGNNLNNELKRLIIHGVMHLLGFDHEQSDSDKQEMEKWENYFFEEVKNIILC